MAWGATPSQACSGLSGSLVCYSAWGLPLGSWPLHLHTPPCDFTQSRGFSVHLFAGGCQIPISTVAPPMNFISLILCIRHLTLDINNHTKSSLFPTLRLSHSPVILISVSITTIWSCLSPKLSYYPCFSSAFTHHSNPLESPAGFISGTYRIWSASIHLFFPHLGHYD